MILLFFFLWVAFNARLDWEVALTGIAVSSVLYWFLCKHMRYKGENDRRIVRKFLKGVRYVLCLIWETMLANAEVSRIVLSKRIEVEPQLIYFKTRLKSKANRVVLAHSITLTPGTVTVSINDNKICIHCLNGKMAQNAKKSRFEEMLMEMEEE